MLVYCGHKLAYKGPMSHARMSILKLFYESNQLKKPVTSRKTEVTEK